nr:hypothetical protein GCM10020063_107640 [Dactylosporangium thailandense]
MDMPKWNDTQLGTMKRAALWLVQVVGEGEIFTKNELRDAFPDVSQIDRRMRDLRQFGWKIDTNREDVSLTASEQRFVRIGQLVWEPGKATPEKSATITASQRHEVLMRDGYKCRSCGIGPGETYTGTEATSQLDVARRPVRLPDGSTRTQLVIECNRCRVGSRELVADLAGVLTRIAKLAPIERRMLSNWVDQDTRTLSTVEDIWAVYRTLPAEARATVQEELAKQS